MNSPTASPAQFATPRRSAGRRAGDMLLQRAAALVQLGGWEIDIGANGLDHDSPARWSDEVYRILGYEPKTIAPSTGEFCARVHPDHVELVRASFERAIASGTDYRAEYQIVRVGGEVRSVEERAIVERDERGAPARVVGTLLDITDRRRLEEALRDGNDAGMRLLSQIVETSHDAILSATVDGVITTWNPAAQRIFGWKPEEIIGQHVTVLAPSDRVSEVLANLRRATTGGSSGIIEAVRLRRDGSLVELELRTSPIHDAAGTVIGASCIARDVSAQRRMAAQVHHAQRLESIGRLAGGVAHDFNNMLMAIMGYTELVRMELAPDAKVQEDLQAIIASTERGARLTRQLLAFACRQVLRPAHIDVNEVIREMQGVLRPLAGSEIALQLDLSPEPATVHVDRAQLEQVVVNLVVNACDAMPRGGALVISTALENDTDRARGGAPTVPAGPVVRVAIADDGIGMSPDVRARLFEPFFTTKPGGTGTGMGLAAVYGIVNQSGGFITVDSEPGIGSTFCVHLPFSPLAEPAVATPTAGRRPSAGAAGAATVLLVEDDPGVRESALAMLKHHGFRVLAAATPSDALALVRAHRDGIDVLVTDIVLPEMSGSQLAERIRAECPGLPVVRMSGFPDIGTHDGDGRVLQKPFTSDTLVRAIRGALTA